MTDVVKRLEAQPAHQRRITNYHSDALIRLAHIASEGKSLTNGDSGAGMATVKHVMRRLCAARESTDPTKLAERAESSKSSGQELVWIRLVPCVKDEAVGRRVHDAMERDRQLNDTKARTEVAACNGGCGDDRRTNLLCHFIKLGRREQLEPCGTFKAREKRIFSNSAERYSFIAHHASPTA
jgi:hypothetical protein